MNLNWTCGVAKFDLTVEIFESDGLCCVLGVQHGSVRSCTDRAHGRTLRDGCCAESAPIPAVHSLRCPSSALESGIRSSSNGMPRSPLSPTASAYTRHLKSKWRAPQIRLPFAVTTAN